MGIASVNPASGDTLRAFDALDPEQLEASVALAAVTFAEYRRSSFFDRARWMLTAAEILEDERESFARMMALEMGKPVRAGADEPVKCAWACRYYAENAESFLAEQEIETQATRSYVSYEPLGVVLAIMPWNFPFWQVIRFAAPALMAGNVAILKHASNVPQCALAIEDIFRRSGFPRGAFQTLLIGSDAVPALLADSRIAAATLTGSEGAGRDVAAAAARHVKKMVLELGGSDPFIVMPTANLDDAVATAVKARTVNSGQSCIAAKRFIIHEKIADAFEGRFVSGMKALKVGDPMDPDTDVGPMATPSILNELDRQVRDSIASGARVLAGGHKLDGSGNFYAPTVLANVPVDSSVAREETFGPVAALFRVTGIDDAIRLANDTAFGLGASAWTNDDSECDRFARGLDAGMVFINAMVASDPRLPFGGVKHSGYGRELGEHGIREFVNIKAVWQSR